MSMSRKSLLAALPLALALVSVVAFRPAPRAEAQTPAVSIPITGTFTDALGGTGTFEGAFGLQRFISQGDQLLAVGTLTGTLTDSAGTVVGTVNQQIQLPVGVTATCDILHLELGPLDLDLLGLVVHLDQVVLDIDAQSGPGNLLGNLLCAVTRLLDSNASTSAIAQLLNRILGAL